MRISNQGLLAAAVLAVFSGVTIAAEAVNPDTLPRGHHQNVHFSMGLPDCTQLVH